MTSASSAKTLTETLPLLLTAAQSAELLGYSVRTFNRLVADGVIPETCKHSLAFGYSRCRKYSRVQLERFAAGELDP